RDVIQAAEPGVDADDRAVDAIVAHLLGPSDGAASLPRADFNDESRFGGIDDLLHHRRSAAALEIERMRCEVEAFEGVDLVEELAAGLGVLGHFSSVKTCRLKPARR